MLTKIVVKFYSDEHLMGIDVDEENIPLLDLIGSALTMSDNWETKEVYHQSESKALDQPMLTVIEARNTVYENCRVTFITSLNTTEALSRIESYVNIARNAMFHGKNW